MKENNLSETLKKLDEIVAWFNDQKQPDLEAGIEKMKDGVELIKKSKSRLKEIENEFEEVQKSLTKELEN